MKPIKKFIRTTTVNEKGGGWDTILPFNEYHANEAKTFMGKDGSISFSAASKLIADWNRDGSSYDYPKYSYTLVEE